MRRKSPSRPRGRFSEVSAVFGLLLSVPAANTFSYVHVLPDTNDLPEFLE